MLTTASISQSVEGALKRYVNDFRMDGRSGTWSTSTLAFIGCEFTDFQSEMTLLLVVFQTSGQKKGFHLFGFIELRWRY